MLTFWHLIKHTHTHLFLGDEFSISTLASKSILDFSKPFKPNSKFIHCFPSAALLFLSSCPQINLMNPQTFALTLLVFTVRPWAHLPNQNRLLTTDLHISRYSDFFSLFHTKGELAPFHAVVSQATDLNCHSLTDKGSTSTTCARLPEDLPPAWMLITQLLAAYCQVTCPRLTDIMEPCLDSRRPPVDSTTIMLSSINKSVIGTSHSSYCNVFMGWLWSLPVFFNSVIHFFMVWHPWTNIDVSLDIVLLYIPLFNLFPDFNFYLSWVEFINQNMDDIILVLYWFLSCLWINCD